MSLFGRYVFRQAGGALLLILLSLTGITWIALALKQLNIVTTQGQSAWLFLKMTLLAIPNLMALIAPLALLIASIHTLNRLNQDSELIVMTASGAPVWRFARPLLVLALLIAILLTFVNHIVMPWSARTIKELAAQFRTDMISQVIQPGNFSSPEPALTFHIRDRNEQTGELAGVILQDERDPKQVVSYLAERGEIVKRGEEAFLILYEGNFVRREPGDQAPNIGEFDRYFINMNRFESKGQEENWRARERYFHELAYPDPKDKAYLFEPGKFRSELHDRFAGALYPFAFVMIVVAFVGQAQTTRQNRTQSVIGGFILAVLSRLAGFASINLLTINPAAVWIVYGIPTLAFVIAAAVAHLRMTPRPGLVKFNNNISSLMDLFKRRGAPAPSPGKIGAARS